MTGRSLFVYPVLLISGISIGLGASNVACNSYDLLVHDHFAQASFSNRVDIMWVVDSSQSMEENQQNLKDGFYCFIEQLAGQVGQACDTDADCPNGSPCSECGSCEAVEGEELELDTLSDAIDVYEQFLGNRTQFLNYQMGVTTTQAFPCEHDGNTSPGCSDHVGTAGRLRGQGNTPDNLGNPPTFLFPDSETLVTDFQALVDVGTEGSNSEFGLWVAAQAACASLDLPFESDFNSWDSDTTFDCSGTNWDESHPWTDICGCMPDELRDYNIGLDDNGNDVRFLRDNSTLVVIVVTDEGDHTTTLGQGLGHWPWSAWIQDECVLGEPWPTSIQEDCEGVAGTSCTVECEIQFMMDFFGALDRRVVFAVMGADARMDVSPQGVYSTEVICNGGTQSLPPFEYYLWATELTNGLYAPIEVPTVGDDSNTCAPVDKKAFAASLSDLGRLVSNLTSGWHLSTVPDLGTVSVFVDGLEVPPAECDPEYQECPPEEPPTCTGTPSAGLNGWTYDESGQSIQFHGDCIPDFNQVVDIYYLPVSGGGRPLPF